MKKVLLLVLVLMSLAVYSKTRKTVYVVVDGIPADYLERVCPKTVFEIADEGGYSRAFTGGEIGSYSQTSTISAIGYMNILTGTWMNKHNVKGNSNLRPNYQYWSLFRIAKSQNREVKTALFSSWTDNRTVLIGEGKEATGGLAIDYVYDGYDLDKTTFPDKKNHLQIFEIDSVVALNAAKCIRQEAPDVSWVYLWYTDSGFHLYGDGSYMDEYVRKTDELLAGIWEAVQYRERHFDEEWMVIITTDHGRTESGYGHGGQHARERSVWISTNYPELNEHFGSEGLSLVDILPSICRFMDFEVPQDVAFEQDGIPFVGRVDIMGLKTHPYDNSVTLSWKCFPGCKSEAVIYMARTNDYKQGSKDNWLKIGTVPASVGKYKVDLKDFPVSEFYKFVVETPNNRLNRWFYK